MSVNHSRAERTEGQIKKSARSGSTGQQRGFVGSGGGGWKGGVSAPPPISSSSTFPSSPVSPSLSTNRSFKKFFNGQSQSTTSRGDASLEASGAAPSASGHHALENGAQPQTHSLGFSDGLDPRAAKPVDMPIPRSASRAIPKPPSSQSGAGFSNSQAPSAPAKGDASKTVTLQFGSINPGIMNGLQIPVPARTSSAPPNLDEQICNQVFFCGITINISVLGYMLQVRTESFRAAPKISAPSVPKQQQQQTKKDVVGVHQSSSGESHSVHVKRDITAPVPSAPVVPAPKSSALPITGISFPIAMPFQPQQPQAPAQFGGPNVQLQSPGLTANSMQMPIALPVGNNPQVAQQIYVPSLQSHFMQQQAMMHPGQGLGFAPPIGHPLPQQLGSLGIGISQFTQQHSGKYSAARKTTVKITHPDTHEELKLDKNTDTIKDNLSAAQRILPNVIPQSQSVPTYAASHQMNFFSPMQQTSYSRPQLMYPTNVPLASGQMPTSSQAPRFSYPVNQSGQNLTYLNSSMSNTVPSGKLASSAPLRGFSEGVNLDSLSVSAPMPNAVQVTIKPSVGSQSVNSGASLSTPSVVISVPSAKTEPSKSVKATEENTSSKQKQTVTKPDEPVQQLKSASGKSNTVKLLVNETSSTNAVPVISTQTVQCENSSVAETAADSGSDLAGNDGRKNESVRKSDSFKNNRSKLNKNDLRTQQRHQLDAFSAEGAKVSPTSENATLLNVEAIEPVEAKVMPFESSSSKEVLKKETSQDASLSYADSFQEIPSESPSSLCQIFDGTDTKSMNSNSKGANTVPEVRKDHILEVAVPEKLKVSDDSSKDANDFEALPSSTHSKSSEQVNAVASSEQDNCVGNFGKVRSDHYDKAIGKLLNDSNSDVGDEMQEVRILSLQNRSTNAYLDAADSEMIANPTSTKHEMKSNKDVDLIDSGVPSMETVNVSDQSLSVEHKPEPKHLDLSSECKPESKLLDSCSDILVSATGLGQTEKPLSEIPKPKISTGKKEKKEILSKADAADTSDLYTAYKGPEEEYTAKKSETINNSTIVKIITQTVNLSKDATSNEEDMHNRAELDDWENAADISTPKLKATDDQQLINDARKQHKKGDGYEAANRNKYTRDFLMTLSQNFTHLPVNFQTGSDIADALLVNLSGHSPSPSTGRVNDRASGASRADRRTVASMDDEKWLKPQVSFGRDIRTDYGHGNATVSLRPGQAGSHVVLRTLPRQTSNPGILSGPMPSPVSQVALQRGNPDADRWNRARRLIPSPHTPLQVMHKAEKKYEVGKVSDEENAKQRQLKAILNKLTPQNFDKLFAQVREVNIDNAMTLTGVISQIFDKALMEPTFCEMYANFCFHLATVLPDFSEDNERITFKRLLLNKCQEEFERGEKEQAEANKDEEEGEIKQFKEEREEKRLRARRRMLGNIRLIGELYKKKMLTERIMHECIKKLLGQCQNPDEYQNPDEEDIEALCKLMSTIGEMIDHPKAKEHMDAYFDMMAKLSTSQKLSSRVRFMLRDAIDLRKNKWQQRRKVEGPKKIDEVHRDAAQERQAQSSRLSRGAIISNVPRRGPAADYGSRGPTLLTSPSTQQVSGIRGLPPQVRGYGIQDVRLEDRHQFEGRTMSLPLQHRSTEDDSITLGPQGGLARGMSIRGQPSISNISSGEIASVVGEHRRTLFSTNDTNYMAERSTGAIFDEISPGYQHNHQSSRDSKISDRTFERSSMAMLPAGPTHGTSISSQSTTPGTRIFSEEVLREKSISAIREFYSAKDEKEVALCVKELNAPDFYPSMISLWVTDSFERKDTERDLLAKLIINFCKSRDSLLSQAQLLLGFELVLSSLEEAVNDAPRAAEFLGRLFTKVLLQNVVTLKDIGKLIQEGGEEPGQLKEIGLAAEVLGNILESIRSESSDVVLNEIRASSNLRLEDFRPPHPLKANKLDEFL